MGIAIKSLANEDISAFNHFLQEDRAALPELKLAPLAPPHEDIAVIAFKRGGKTQNRMDALVQLSEKHQFVLTEHDAQIVSLSRHLPVKQVIIPAIFFRVMSFTRRKC